MVIFMFREKEKKCGKDRMAGIINGEVDVERLESDSDDFYAGYVAGVKAAYLFYIKRPKCTCPFQLCLSCDRSIPCDNCDFNHGFKRELSVDYCRGYSSGYERCSAAWDDFFPEEIRKDNGIFEYSNEEKDDYCERGEFDENGIWNSKYILGYKKGYNNGFEDGQSDGMDEVLELDEDVLDAIFEIRQQIKEIQGLAQRLEEPDAVTSRMVVELYGVQGKLTDLTQILVMDNVFMYWHKRQIEEDR